MPVETPPDPNWFSVLKEWLGLLKDLIPPTLAAGLGALWKHTNLVKAGRRRFWTAKLLLEVPGVIGLGTVAGGVAQHLGAPPLAAMALATVCGYLGPQILHVIVERLLGIYMPPPSNGGAL